MIVWDVTNIQLQMDCKSKFLKVSMHVHIHKNLTRLKGKFENSQYVDRLILCSSIHLFPPLLILCQVLFCAVSLSGWLTPLWLIVVFSLVYQYFLLSFSVGLSNSPHNLHLADRLTVFFLIIFSKGWSLILTVYSGRLWDAFDSYVTKSFSLNLLLNCKWESAWNAISLLLIPVGFISRWTKADSGPYNQGKRLQLVWL